MASSATAEVTAPTTQPEAATAPSNEPEVTTQIAVDDVRITIRMRGGFLT
jgi:hypothetical protein